MSIGQLTHYDVAKLQNAQNTLTDEELDEELLRHCCRSRSSRRTTPGGRGSRSARWGRRACRARRWGAPVTAAAAASAQRLLPY